MPDRASLPRPTPNYPHPTIQPEPCPPPTPPMPSKDSALAISKLMPEGSAPAASSLLPEGSAPAASSLLPEGSAPDFQRLLPEGWTLVRSKGARSQCHYQAKTIVVGSDDPVVLLHEIGHAIFGPDEAKAILLSHMVLARVAPEAYLKAKIIFGHHPVGVSLPSWPLPQRHLI